MKSPIIWFGGKGNFVKNLLNLIPKHRIFVEVFGGGASLLFAHNPSPIEIYNDLDFGLVSYFRVIRDPEKFEKFYKRVQLIPYSREEYNYCRETWESCEDEIERALRWYVVCRQSFSGIFGRSWSFEINNSHRRMAQCNSKWLSTIQNLRDVHHRLLRIQIENQSFEKIIEIYDTPDTFFYLDPPYVAETRRDGEYKHEMNDSDHRRLVELAMKCSGKIMISGYASDLYSPLDTAGWIRTDIKTSCFAVGRTRATGIRGNGSATRMQSRIETIYMNYRLNGVQLDLFQEKNNELRTLP